MENTEQNALNWLAENNVLATDSQTQKIALLLVAYASQATPKLVLPSDEVGKSILESILGKCTCDGTQELEGTENRLECNFCAGKYAFEEYASAVCADKDREILHLTDQLKSAQAEVERLKWEKELMLRSNTRWTEKAKQLESELAESNRRVAEIEDTWTGKENGLP